MQPLTLIDIVISLRHWLLLLGSVGVLSGVTRAWDTRANPSDHSDPRAVNRKGFEQGVLIGLLTGLLMVPSRILSNQPATPDW